ncbi:TetR family transcriptional regulator C-terminal domain-containing protein [Streptomyces sp. NPDC019937]|uniref:TetR family transcriptional regulator C-terminal domain-containing protein n=1 Tax=Streptomyces sp. NPDC019937 TaxID=3154787 RepID=UPI0033E2C749
MPFTWCGRRTRCNRLERQLADVLRQAQADGELAADLDAAVEAAHVPAMSHGLATSVLVGRRTVDSTACCSSARRAPRSGSFGRKWRRARLRAVAAWRDALSPSPHTPLPSCVRWSMARHGSGCSACPFTISCQP